MNSSEAINTQHFFGPHEMQDRLFASAGRWVGTPFAAHGSIAGAGVDCVNLVGQIYLAVGFLKDFHPPAYQVGEGKHLEESKLIAWFEAHPKFTSMPLLPAEYLPGDSLCFQFRQRVPHHVGLKLYDDKFIHVLEGRRVTVASLSDHTYGRTLRAIYRPIQ